MTCCNLGSKKLSEAEITGTRKNYEITIFPSTVKSGELLTVRLPQLRKDGCLIPDSVNIAFEFKLTGTKATCVNNLAKALVKGFSVKFGNKDIYNNTGENTFSLFRDLWQTNDERQRKLASGIMTETMRKTWPIQLGQILENCGLFAPCAVREEFEFEIRLASNDEILVPRGKDGVVGSYELVDLRLEYEVIENKELTDKIVELYDGEHTLSFEDVMSYRTET